MAATTPLSIVHVSSLPPTACGVAEYTVALANHLHTDESWIRPFFVRLDCDFPGAEASDNRITINPLEKAALATAVQAVNRLERKVVLLQHEFKLYGGAHGENVLQFLEALKSPVITTLHTVNPSLPPVRQQIFGEIIRRSSIVAVFSDKAAEILTVHYKVEAKKIKVIPHGVPDVSFRKPEEFNWPGLPHDRVKFITSGLLRPAKGIENVLAALRDLKKNFQKFIYVICGADHPRNLDAAKYRRQLISLVSDYGLKNHVLFIDRYLESTEMVNLTQACDVGILAYTAAEQSSSGVLAFMLSCGRPVIATDFQYAKASLNGSNGVVVPLGNVEALTSAIKWLAADAERRKRMMENSYNSTRSWLWQKIAQEHLKMVKEAERLLLQ